MKKQQNVDKTLFWKYSLPDSDAINHELATQFDQNKVADRIQKTHYFNGRYENIYICETDIPSIIPVLQHANERALEILEISEILSIGFWFNWMEPGHTTTRHCHDEDDELLSAVYYVRAKKEAGDLILYAPDEKIHLSPEEGTFVFLRPETEHEVLENQSDSSRLSIGMNFGIKGELSQGALS